MCIRTQVRDVCVCKCVCTCVCACARACVHSTGAPLVRAGALPEEWSVSAGSSPSPAAQQPGGRPHQRATQPRQAAPTQQQRCEPSQAGTKLRVRTFCPLSPCRFSFSRAFNGAWPCLLSPRLPASGCAQPNMRVCASRTLSGRTIVASPQAGGVPGEPQCRPKGAQLELAAPCAVKRAASLEQAACSMAAPSSGDRWGGYVSIVRVRCEKGGCPAGFLPPPPNFLQPVQQVRPCALCLARPRSTPLTIGFARHRAGKQRSEVLESWVRRRSLRRRRTRS